MFVKLQESTNEYNWDLHNKVIFEVISFLEAHHMIPTKLNIQANGWTEAYFIHKDSLRNLWQNLEAQGTVELEQPILEVDTNNQGKLNRVKFRLIPHVSKWDRIKKLVS